MNIQKYAKEEIALNQIETALELFFKEGDLFSVITLAGAAEEIIGQLLQQRSENQGLLELFNSVLDVLRPASRKEQKKEGPLSHETDLYIHMDVYREAVFLLGRAIDDYRTLSGTLSQAMLKFHEVRVNTP